MKHKLPKTNLLGKKNWGKLCDGLQNVKGTDLKAREITQCDSKASSSTDNENVHSKTEAASPVEKVAEKLH